MFEDKYFFDEISLIFFLPHFLMKLFPEEHSFFSDFFFIFFTFNIKISLLAKIRVEKIQNFIKRIFLKKRLLTKLDFFIFPRKNVYYVISFSKVFFILYREVILSYILSLRVHDFLAEK